jgi:hypothetical protein
MKDQSHPDEAIAREVDRRVNDASVAFSTDDRSVALHAFRHVGFADRGSVNLASKASRYGLQSMRGCEVGDYGTGCPAKNKLRCQHESTFFAYRLSLLRDHSQAIGVHVLSEADIRVMFMNRSAQGAA